MWYLNKTSILEEEHNDQSLQNMAWRWSGHLLFLPPLSLPGQHSPICRGESCLCHSQPNLIPVKLISLLSPRGQHWVFHCLGQWLAWWWTYDPNQANQDQSWDLNPGLSSKARIYGRKGSVAWNHCTPLPPTYYGIWRMNTRVKLGGEERGVMQWGYRFSQGPDQRAL